MASQSDIVAQIRDTLTLTDPELDTSVGSVTRKIIDAVAEAISEAYIDQQMLGYTYDIDAKMEGDLDAFCNLFGISRLPGKRATGVVVFARSSNATDQFVVIPSGTQIVAREDADSQPVILQTLSTGFLSIGDTSVSIPVQAVQAGPEANLPAGAINSPVSPVEGIATITNPDPISGGTNMESDAQLRERWKATVFRNMAGTECQPPGTQVLVPRKGKGRKVRLESVPIESLRAGDKVVSWRRGVLLREGSEITGITSNEYSGPLVVVKDEKGRVSRYTPNHRCIAKIGPALEGKHIVYLQRRGTSFRIGTTTDRRSNGSGIYYNASGLADRLGSQGADEAWILSVHDTKADALLAEAYASWKFSIPMTLFRANHARDGVEVQERLDMFWNKVGDLTNEAIDCLAHHGRMMRYPLMRRGTKKTWNRASEIEACNLFNGVELIDAEATIDNGATQYVSVQVDTEFYEGPVWSMDVDKHQTYVADGFVTHNSMYLGLAMDNQFCFAANVVGATKRRREILQIQGGSATSTNNDAKFVYAGNLYVGRNIDNGDIFVQGLDYSWTNTVPPEVTVLNPNAIPDGTLIEVDYEYVPTMSRNDPEDRITNRIDVWCAGSDPRPASQSIVFRPSPVFDSNPDSVYYTGNFTRLDGSHPDANHTFVPLAFGPIITVPSTITVGGTTYGEVTPDHPMDSTANGIVYAYNIVHQSNEFGYAPNSLFGLEWSETNRPSSNASFEVEYYYNNVPRDIQNKIEQWRLVGTDAVAHQAIANNIRVNVVVQYDNPLRQDEINAGIVAELDAFFRNSGIGRNLQPSDVLNVIANASGVDAVRFQHGSDHADWDSSDPNAFNVGLQRIVNGNVIESYVDANGRPLEVHFGDAEYPVFGDVKILVRASNNFGAS